MLRSGVVTVDANGAARIPGGIRARIGPGAAGAPLPFPLVGTYGDGNGITVVFFGTEPTPLPDSANGGHPDITFSGLTAGLVIAYQVATSEAWASKLAGGGAPGASGADGNLMAAPPRSAAMQVADVIAVTTSAVATLLTANASRRSLSVQNQGLGTVVISTDPAPNAAGGAGSKVLAVLAACSSAAYDGTGGTFSLDGYTGALYAKAVGANGDVSVGAI